MSSAETRRRTRRLLLLLSAILVPTAVVVLLLVRVVRQENELAERRAAEERREALDQLRRELAARLQALRLEEVNRLMGESGRRLPPDSPIVFVAPMVQDHMVLPWEEARTARQPPEPFLRDQREGEALEFQHHDAAAAVAVYGHAVSIGRTPADTCAARLWMGRAARKAGMTEAARRIDRQLLPECADVADADGIPFALYAAERLLAEGEDAAAVEYVIRSASPRQWRSPNEAYALRSLLGRLSTPAAAGALRTLGVQIHNIDQIAALAQDMHDHLGTLQRAFRSAPGDLSWLGYGDEPWLLTLVSPTSFAAPVVMAVSAGRVVPRGVTIRATVREGAVPLGDGFVGLYAEWPASRFAAPPAVPAVLYGTILFVVLGTVLFAGYLVLRDVHREAQTAEMRSHFVASVSHELKTPLTSIRAHAETLLLGRGSEATSEYLQTIVSESERLTRLVDSVLEFSRIEQGRKTYHLQPTRLDEVVRSAARTMEYPLSQLGFTLTLSSDGSNPMVEADREALTQAILNLLGNAMKYSGEARQVEMRCGTRDAEAFVDVVDHGIGISRDDQSRIFERFHRVQSVETAGIAGTGLGLALTLHVVEAHRGRMAVVSERGRGSTFSVLIPVQGHA